MDNKNTPHRVISLGIVLVAAVLLLAVIPFADNAEGATHDIKAYVYDNDNNTPIENVKVTLYDPDEGTFTSKITNSDGYMKFEDRDSGHYVMQYSHPLYSSQTFYINVNDRDSIYDPITLSMIPGATPATLKGNVTDDDGNPAIGAYVYLRDQNALHDDPTIFNKDTPHTIMTKTGSGGAYEFKDAYAGNFDLVTRVGTNQYYYGTESNINLVAGDNTAPDLVYTNQGKGNKVFVKVRDNDGIDITNGVWIVVYDPVTDTWNSSTSNPGGIYVLNGNYDLIVRAVGYKSSVQSITVNGYTPITVNLDDMDYTTRETDVQFTDWGNATYESTATWQFDDSVFYLSDDYGVFQSGIVRYDIDRLFGDGDGTLNDIEANAYQAFQNGLGPDAIYSWSRFNVGALGDLGYEYKNFNADFDKKTDDAMSMDPLEITYTFDLEAVQEVDAFDVHIKVENEHAMISLPDGYEIISKGSYVSFDENDTTMAEIDTLDVDGIIDILFYCGENKLPEPVIDTSDDFEPENQTYLYRADEYIEFNASQSNDPSPYGKIMEYKWTFDDARAETNDTMVATRKFSEGMYTVTLEVTDNAGGTATTNITIIVDGTLPDVDFTAEPVILNQFLSGIVNHTLYLNITQLMDEYGIHEEILWDYGDDNTTTVSNMDNKNVTYKYIHLNASKLTGVNDNEYTYTITLTVWDKAGNEQIVTKDITINNTKRPVAYFTVSDDMVVGDGYYVFKVDENITFNATESHGLDMEIVNYTWNFGDGTNLSYEMIVNHTYAVRGNYTATLTIIDSEGGKSNETHNIYIDDQAPTVTFDIEGAWFEDPWYFIDQNNGTNTIDEYLFNLTAAGTMDVGPVGDIEGLYNYTWDFEIPDKPGKMGDVDNNITYLDTTYSFSAINNTAKNVTIGDMTHYYYTITLTVFDRAGNEAMFQRNIIVNDTEAPEAKFSYDEEIDEGISMELNATKSTDNIGIVEYKWSIEDPEGEFNNVTGMIANVVFDTWGTHTVTLTVIDIAGNEDTHDAIVEVKEIPKVDLVISSGGIFYSEDTIYEGDTITIMVNVTNDGMIEAFNVTVHFFFRESLDGERVHIGDHIFDSALVPSETRLAIHEYKAKKSGQIIANVTMNGTRPEGTPNFDSDLTNNEAFQDILVEDKDEDTNWFLIIGTSTAVGIVAVIVIVMWKKPELMGLKSRSPVGKKSINKKK